MKFKTMLDKTAAAGFLNEFSKEFEAECDRQFGAIYPHDTRRLIPCAETALRRIKSRNEKGPHGETYGREDS